MSFQLRRHGRVPRRQALGNVVDDLLLMSNPTLARWATNHSPEVAADRACLASANQAVANMDNAVYDLAGNWNPSGIYTLQQLDAIIGSVFAMITNATQTVDKAIAEPMAQGDRDALIMNRTRARNRVGVDGIKFVNASRDAKAKGIELIDAPGLKRWIMGSMRDAAECIVGVQYVMCARPWFVGALQGFMAVFNAVYSVARAIVGVAYDVAKAAGMAVLSVPDMISTGIKVAKWSVIGGIAYLLYKGEHKKLLAKL